MELELTTNVYFFFSVNFDNICWGFLKWDSPNLNWVIYVIILSILQSTYNNKVHTWRVKQS